MIKGSCLVLSISSLSRSNRPSLSLNRLLMFEKARSTEADEDATQKARRAARAHVGILAPWSRHQFRVPDGVASMA